MQMRRGVFLLVGALAAFGCSDPAPTTGSLTVNITGLPGGALALVRITGPENFLRTLNASETLEQLVPGDYIVRMDTILHSNTKYGVPIIRDTVQVTRGATQTADVPYNISSGSLDLTISGLPPGIAADVRLVKPGFSASIISSGIIPGLEPGKYYVQSDTFTTGQGDRFGSPKILDSVTVQASTTPATAAVSYTLVSATLALTVNGLPAGFGQQPITITGPNGYSAKFSGTTTVRGLNAGTYSVVAQTANGTCPTIYRTSSTPQNLSIAAAATGSATVTYSQGTADPAELNLRIEAVHVIQVTQDAQWSVPMVAGRPALVRVIGIANQCNTAMPKVRLTIGSAAPVTINAPESSVRFISDEGTLTSTWNYNVPGSLVTAGMSIVAEMDFDGAVAETNESDNRYPSSGSRPVIVKTVPTIGILFVPISQVVNGAVLTGDVAGKTDAFMDWPKRLHPVANFDIKVREPYSTSIVLVATGNAAFSTWSQLLGEIDAQRKLSTDSARYHYGVVKVTYGGGVAGIGYTPGKAAMGWDYAQSASSIMAHELGHNYARFHSPCGQPGGIDPGYPSTGFYSGGRIGVYGYDQISGSLKNPELYTDIMGYCNTQWISDYTYVGMMTYLSDPNRAPALSGANAARQPSLLVWGRIENGVPILEPAFEIDAYPSMPASAGPSRITATDASGAEVLSFAFAGQRIADLPGDNETFSFVVPLSALRGRSVESLRLSARGRTSTNVASAVVDADPGVVATRPAAGRVRLRWDARRYPVLMVRNRATGNVIAFARGGDATIVGNQDEVEVNASNRIRSARSTVRVLK